jgi:putative membrane protein
MAVLGAGALYGCGVTRAWSRAGTGRVVRPWQVGCFATALAATAVALCSPLDARAETSLTAHMTQHVILISVAAPLFAVGAPFVGWIEAFDPRGTARSLRRWPRRLGRRGRRLAIVTALALFVHTVTVAVWHLPSAYSAAVTNPAVHGMEHLTFVVSAAVLWWAALGTGRRSARGAGVVVLFVTTLPLNALGLLMTLARSPWYPHYVHGSVAQALEDQQVAGVVMWGFGGVAALVGAFALFVSWLDGLERSSPARGGAEPSRPALRSAAR